MATPAPLIELSGPPLERGRTYGEAARERIHRGIGHYSEQILSSVSRAEMTSLVTDFLPVIEGFAPDYIVEMRGIAEGANVAFEDVVLLNARTEILKLGPKLAATKAAGKEEPDGCTGVVALPSITADGKLIHAQNWDWKAECAETAVVLKIAREDGPDLLTFTEAGGLARSGFNAAGISITANYLESERDYAQRGVPLALIRRKVLEQQHLALAWRAVYTTQKSASNNMIVAQAEGLCIDFECAPDESFQVHPEDGLLVHANHWQSPVALGKIRDTGIVNTPDSLYRDLRVRDLTAPHRGHVTRDTIKAALFDDYQTPWSVCRPPRKGLGNGNLSATVAMIVMIPADGLMEVAMLPALDRTFTRYTLAMERAAHRARTDAGRGRSRDPAADLPPARDGLMRRPAPAPAERLPTLLLVAASVLVLIRLVPGDPAQLMLGDSATPEQVAESLAAPMGLDVPDPAPVPALASGRSRRATSARSITNGLFPSAACGLDLLRRHGRHRCSSRSGLAAAIAVPLGVARRLAAGRRGRHRRGGAWRR